MGMYRLDGIRQHHTERSVLWERRPATLTQAVAQGRLRTGGDEVFLDLQRHLPNGDDTLLPDVLHDNFQFSLALLRRWRYESAVLRFFCLGKRYPRFQITSVTSRATRATSASLILGRLACRTS